MKDKRIETTCPNCGKSFWYYKSWPRKYCSQKCSAVVNAKKNLSIIDNPPIEVICEGCNKTFFKKQNQIKNTKHNFCSHKCYGKYLSETKKGIPRPEVRGILHPGMKGEKPHLQKRVDKQCPQCNKIFQVKQSHAERRKFCSKVCQAEYQKSITGENSFNYKGGYKPYYGPNWRQQRRNIRYRDNYTCQHCGITEKELGRQLDVHHIKPFREFGIDRYKEANHSNNLICYCNTCHLIIGHKESKNHSICSLENLS